MEDRKQLIVSDLYSDPINLTGDKIISKLKNTAKYFWGRK